MDTPSHCGIVGNELADQLAKQGAAEHQTENQVALHKQDPDQGRREAEAFSCFRSPAFHLESSSRDEICGLLQCTHRPVQLLLKWGGRRPDLLPQQPVIPAVLKQRPEREDYHLLGRAEQVVIFRPRTEHCRLKQHVYRKLKIAPTPYCQCGQVEQMVSHILQDCPLLDQLRQTWP